MRIALDEAINAACICTKNTLDMLWQLFRSRSGSSMQTQAARKAIRFNSYLAKDFTKATRSNTPIEFHLPQPLLRMHKALREEQIIFIVGVNMWHTITVSDGFNRFMQP